MPKTTKWSQLVNSIAVFNEKGTVGKTPLALNIALHFGYNFATNQNRSRKKIEKIIPKTQFLKVEPHEAFPKFENNFNVVFDLAGELVGYEESLISALEQAEIIVIPLINGIETIDATIETLAELDSIATITKNIVIVANMIRKPSDITEIENGLRTLIERDIPIIPVRFTKGFEYQQKQGQSIQSLVKIGGWYKSKFSTLCDDLDILFTYLKK